MCLQAKWPLEKAKQYILFQSHSCGMCTFISEENISLVSKSSDTLRIYDMYFDKQARYVSIWLRCPLNATFCKTINSLQLLLYWFPFILPIRERNRAFSKNTQEVQEDLLSHHLKSANITFLGVGCSISRRLT